MKATTLRMLVGVTAPLILTGSVQAEFTGISTASKPNPFGLLVVNVYANFDRPGQDHMIAVAGTPNTPLQIDVFGGVFYNHPFGYQTAPLDLLVQSFPSLAFDSFVTIGVKSVGQPNGQPVDNTILTPNYPPIKGNQKFSDSSGWAITPVDPQGNPFDPVNSFPGNGQILIAQFSTADGFAIEGQFLISAISNGTAMQAQVSFQHMLEPPCPWDVEPMGGDGIVGITDFLVLLAAGGPNPGHPADFDGDGNVGIVDFLELLANWGACP